MEIIDPIKSAVKDLHLKNFLNSSTMYTKLETLDILGFYIFIFFPWLFSGKNFCFRIGI